MGPRPVDCFWGGGGRQQRGGHAELVSGASVGAGSNQSPLQEATSWAVED